MKFIFPLALSFGVLCAQASTIKFKPTTVIFNQDINLNKKAVLGGNKANIKLNEACYLNFWGDMITSFPAGTVLRGTSHIWDRHAEGNERVTELRFQSEEGDIVGFFCIGTSVPSYSQVLALIKPYVTVK